MPAAAGARVLFALALLSLAASVAHAQLTARGSVPLTATTYLTSTSMRTILRFEETLSVSSPELLIETSFEAPLDKILSLSGNNITITLPASASAGSRWTPDGLLLTAVTGSLLLWHGPKAAVLVLGTIAATQVAMAAPSDYCQITVRYPPGYSFADLHFSLAAGSAVTSLAGRLSANSLFIDVGAASGVTSGLVGLSNVSIASRLWVQSEGEIIVEKFAAPSTASADRTLMSATAVTLTVMDANNTIRGPIVAEHSGQFSRPAVCNTTAVGAVANSAATRTEILCAAPGPAVFATLRSDGPVTLLMLDAAGLPIANTGPGGGGGGGDGCTTFATFDSYAGSPPIASAAKFPGYTWSLNEASLWEGGSTAWNSRLAATPRASGFAIRRPDGQNIAWGAWMRAPALLPLSLSPSISYRFNFSISQNASNADALTPLNYTACLYQLSQTDFSDSNTRQLYYGPPGVPRGALVLQTAPLSPAVIPSATVAAQSWQFTPPALCSRCYVGILLDWPDRGYGGRIGDFFFTDLSFEQLPSDVQVPTVNYGISDMGAARIPEMPTVPEANPRTGCPFLAADLRRWEDAATWPAGSVPAAGAQVTLPDNTKVLVTACSFSVLPYASITVPATSELVFADAAISLNVGFIQVSGALRIGSPTCKLFSQITITFFGTRGAPIDKGIIVEQGGVIEIFGKQYAPTWTRLAAPAWPGQDRIWLRDAPNWEVGQRVLLVTSYFRDADYDMNEVLTVAAVSGRQVQFTAPLRWYHHAGPEYQSEVALLSRRIVLQGDASSADSAYGGHVMIKGQGRIQSVALYRMGQNNTIARYPLHFHLMGVAPTSYFTDNSVYDAFFRCYTIHATHNTLVSRNVAYNTSGHCYYMEDGVEENNTISYNLAALVKVIGDPATAWTQFMGNQVASADRELPADSAASGFYITNMQNIVTGNAASGGWAGYALPMFDYAMGLSRGTPMNPPPRHKAVLLFDGNTAHSSGHYWSIFSSCLYSGGSLFYDSSNGDALTYNGGRGAGTRTVQYWQGSQLLTGRFNITNFKAWLCGQGANHWGNSMNFLNAEVFDSGRGATLFGPTWVGNSIFGVTANPMGWPKTDYWRGTLAFQFYDQWSQVVMTNVTLRNYKQDARWPLTTDIDYSTNCFSCLGNGDGSVNQGISLTSGVKFVNCDTSVLVQNTNTSTGRASNILDEDGTITGVSGGAIIGGSSPHWSMAADCYYQSQWASWVCPRKADRDIAQLLLNIPNYLTLDMTSTAIAYTLTMCGRPQASLSVKFAEPGVSGCTGEGWFFTFPGQPGSPKVISFSAVRLDPAYKVIAVLSYPAGTTFTVRWADRNLSYLNGNFTEVASLAAVKSLANTNVFFFDTATNYFYLGVQPTLPVSFFVGGPSRLPNFDSNQVLITVTASCTANTAGFCTSSTTLPLSINA